MKQGLKLFTNSLEFGQSQVAGGLCLEANDFLAALGLWIFNLVYFRHIIPIGLPPLS